MPRTFTFRTMLDGGDLTELKLRRADYELVLDLAVLSLNTEALLRAYRGKLQVSTENRATVVTRSSESEAPRNPCLPRVMTSDPSHTWVFGCSAASGRVRDLFPSPLYPGAEMRFAKRPARKRRL
jgi:hypothetical protein